MRFEEVVDTVTLLETLSGSASVKISSLLGGSGSGSVKFSRTVDFNQTSTNFAFRAIRNFGAQYLVPKGLGMAIGQARLERHDDEFSVVVPATVSAGSIPAIRLRPEAAKLLAEQPLEFYKVCGDSFVSVIYTSVGIQGLFSFLHTTREEREEISGKIEANFLSSNVSADSTALSKRYASNSRLKINYFQLGGKELPNAITEAALRKLIEDIGKAPAADATRVEMGISYYRDLPNFPQGAGSDFSLLNRMANRWLELKFLFDYLDAVNREPANYVLVGLGGQRVRDAQDAIGVELAELKHSIDACVATPDHCVAPPRGTPKDYDYRKRMPLSKAVSETWRTLQEFESKLAAARKKRDALSPTVMKDFLFGNLVSRREVPNPDYVVAAAEVNAAQANLNEATAQQISRDAHERFKVFVDGPARIRCRRNQDACLTNAQLSEIQDEMAPPVALNPIGKLPPPACKMLGICPSHR